VYKLPISSAGGKSSYTDSLNKNSQQIAIAKAFAKTLSLHNGFLKATKKLLQQAVSMSHLPINLNWAAMLVMGIARLYFLYEWGQALKLLEDELELHARVLCCAIFVL